MPCVTAEASTVVLLATAAEMVSADCLLPALTKNVTMTRPRLPLLCSMRPDGSSVTPVISTFAGSSPRAEATLVTRPARTRLSSSVDAATLSIVTPTDTPTVNPGVCGATDEDGEVDTRAPGERDGLAEGVSLRVCVRLAEGERDTLLVGEVDAITDGLTEVDSLDEGEIVGVSETDADTLGDADDVASTDALLLAVGETLPLADVLAETDGETGLRVREAVTDAEAEMEADRDAEADGDCTGAGIGRAQRHK